MFFLKQLFTFILLNITYVQLALQLIQSLLISYFVWISSFPFLIQSNQFFMQLDLQIIHDARAIHETQSRLHSRWLAASLHLLNEWIVEHDLEAKIDTNYSHQSINSYKFVSVGLLLISSSIIHSIEVHSYFSIDEEGALHSCSVSLQFPLNENDIFFFFSFDHQLVILLANYNDEYMEHRGVLIILYIIA